MTRPMVYGCVVIALAAATPAWAYREELVSQTAAARHGLVRAWMAQVDVDGGRSRVADLVLYRGALYVLSTTGVIHAYDAETGRALWNDSKQVGLPRHPTSAMDAYEHYLALTNGSRLYVLNRHTGELLWDRQVDGVPVAPPTLSDRRVYVPIASGVVLAYRLMREGEENRKGRPRGEAEQPVSPTEIKLSPQPTPPMMCRGKGRCYTQPMLIRQTEAEELLAWSTDEGLLIIAGINRENEDRFAVRSQMETGGDVAARPAFVAADPKIDGDSGVLVAVSQNGFVHAISGLGEPLWRFPAGAEIVEPPAAVDHSVYVCLQLGGMFAIEPRTGEQKWFVPEPVRFLAASDERVYAADKLGAVHVYDVKTGGKLDLLPFDALAVRLMNQRTDRLYLSTLGGLVQCFRETRQVEPIVYGLDRKVAVKAEERKRPKIDTSKKKSEGEEPAAKPPADDPFGTGMKDDDKPAAKPAADDPFGTGDKPAAKPAADDPFGTATPAAKQ